MREIELKAHVRDLERTLSCFRSYLGEGKEVHKKDTYLRRPGEKIQSMRIRKFPERLEVTTKQNSRKEGLEDNSEYEFSVPLEEYDKAILFFNALGHEYFFTKEKDGYEWQDGDAHIELLEVNDLGWFLEIEVLLPFTSSDDDAGRAREEILALFGKAGIENCDIEEKAYRDMILGGDHGVQGEPYTGEGQRHS